MKRYMSLHIHTDLPEPEQIKAVNENSYHEPGIKICWKTQIVSVTPYKNSDLL